MKIIWAILGVCLVTYLASIVANKDQLVTKNGFEPPSSATGPQTPFKLGLITILSGQFSDFGQASANAARLAVKDYLAKHPNQQVEFILEDDGGDQKKGLSAYQKLRSIDRADMILPISTFGIGAVADIINREKRLTFILGNEPYEPKDDYIYMVTPAAVPAQEAFGAHIAREHPSGSIFVVVSQNEALFRFARAIKDGTSGRAELIELPPDSSDYRSTVTAIRAKNPVAIAFLAMPKDAALFLKQMRTMQLNPKLYFDETISNSISDFKTVLGDISFLAQAGFLGMTAEPDANFISHYQNEFGTVPQAWTDFAYDAVYLALSLKDKDSDVARQWLKTNVYHGFSGKIEFDALGLRKPAYRITSLGDDPRFWAAAGKN